MLRELLISSPLLIAGVFAFYYFHNSNGISAEQAPVTSRNRPTEEEQDELVRRLMNDIEHEQDLLDGEYDEEDIYESDEEGAGLANEYDEGGFDATELPEEFRRRINPTPAQLAAENAAAAGSSTSASSSRRNRTVGAKKSKSLARKDRIRAYNEYVRQEAEAERLRQQEFNEAHADLIAEAKREREQREASAEAQIQKRRAEKREREEHEKLELAKLKESLRHTLTSVGSVKLQNDAEREVAKEIEEGIVVANGDWLVMINEKMLSNIAATIKASGRVSFADLTSSI
ncbi:hypothetical protein AWJ20_3121 [Sugiyamaella lignohabitans]|uniref:Uncharacterized protein n=1 Tax=Sugiyamaella lignohabitans TaxID=796027 RepID=A0A167FMX4_9ASCO|nr:uncharacterized protein AWJ20_3121 [Sugiyamaella lignohabitans]ANB15493.1 hypothetical protein AWJ20_3121 [Sugiyamaella lignohabitans]